MKYNMQTKIYLNEKEVSYLLNLLDFAEYRARDQTKYMEELAMINNIKIYLLTQKNKKNEKESITINTIRKQN